MSAGSSQRVEQSVLLQVEFCSGSAIKADVAAGLGDDAKYVIKMAKHLLGGGSVDAAESLNSLGDILEHGRQSKYFVAVDSGGFLGDLSGGRQ